MKKYLILGFVLCSSVVYAGNTGYGPFGDGSTCNVIRSKVIKQTDLSKFTVNECRPTQDVVLGTRWWFSVSSK